jgi:hypothetical protein
MKTASVAQSMVRLITRQIRFGGNSSHLLWLGARRLATSNGNETAADQRLILDFYNWENHAANHRQLRLVIRLTKNLFRRALSKTFSSFKTQV